MSDHTRLTRRAVLLGAGAAIVTACRPRRQPRAAHPVDLDLAALSAAIAGERELIATYEALPKPAAGADTGYSTSVHAAHEQHLAALQRAAGRSDAVTSTPSPAAAVTEKRRRAAEARSARSLSASAVAARDGQVAALLASIAAAHQTYGRTGVVTFSSEVTVP
ncbi:MAG TPA: hypothetical protein VFJ17_12195 [Mycobacteriales bacterium]|jgi:hypothetical protein|nr:hypothetical protein [Mycobacteriales bacterium]